MQCEICGTEVDFPIQMEMDGITFLSCKQCGQHGRIIDQPDSPSSPASHASHASAPARPDIKKFTSQEFLVKDYGKRLMQARQKKQLTLKELALALKVQESYLRKIESMHLIPEDTLVKKLENYFDIALKEVIEDED